MRSDYEFCTVAIDGHLLTVTLNRPAALNAMHPPMHDELEEVWNAYAVDDSLWVAILTGAGDRAFCAGYDLKWVADGRELRSAHGGTGFAGLTSRYDLDKPVIAAVNGFATGGGFETVLACDLVIADERAQFALSEPRVGLAALAGGLHRLPRQIGLKPALGIILTGRRVGADEALRFGIVNEVAPAGHALEIARRWADEILECSPMSVRASKQVVYGQLDIASYREAYRTRFPALDRWRASADYKEGPRAFVEKRKPRWGAE